MRYRINIVDSQGHYQGYIFEGQSLAKIMEIMQILTLPPGSSFQVVQVHDIGPTAQPAQHTQER